MIENEKREEREEEEELEENQEETKCEICLDGTVYENNILLVCRKCHIVVHQSCYCVDEVPEDEWCCDLCSQDRDPNSVSCVICNHSGSALKQTETPDKWIHVLCGMWIPEVFVVDGVQNISRISTVRYKYSCKLCHKKGAIIQCSYGRCALSAHPWCAVKLDLGWKHRIVKDPDHPSTTLWEVFCKTHAHAVSEPVKPKVKAKRTSIEEEQFERNSVDRKKKSGKTKKKTPKVIDLDFEGSDDDFVVSVSSSKKGSHPPSSNARKKGRPPPYKSNSLDDDIIRLTSATPKGKRGGGSVSSMTLGSDNEYGTPLRSGEGSESEVEGNGYPFAGSSLRKKQKSKHVHPIYTFSEWPGQSEGEPMDLPHIWNVISMMYPEDYSKEWIEYMLSAFKVGPTNAFLPEVDKFEDTLAKIPPLGSLEATLQKLSAGDEEIINASSITERDFIALMDPDRRRDLEQKIDRHIDLLDKLVSQQQAPSPTVSSSLPCFHSSQMNSITSEVHSCQKDINPEHMTDFVRVLHNGNQSRVDCHFQIRLRSNDENIREVSRGDVIWRDVNLVTEEPGETPMTLYQKYGIICPEIPDDLKDEKSMKECIAEYCLVKSEFYDPNLPVFLPERDIIPFVEESDEICSFIRRDISMLDRLVHATSRAVETCENLPNFQGLSEVIDTRMKTSKVAEIMIRKYQNQRVWGFVCRGLQRGIKDQPLDFNQAKLDSIPASWTIRVEGRPEEQAEDNEAQTDTVCMCCFDGLTSDDANKIIFCDGCNSSLHQLCYGIQTIPEGEYYCDRCQFIRNSIIQDDDQYDPIDLKNIAVCCLCSTHHGGLKETTDGRWVHMCCAFWSGKCQISNLETMSLIDISQVPIRGESKLRKSREKRYVTFLNGDEIEDDVESDPVSCRICHQRGGYFAQCCHEAHQQDGHTPSYFHPLCAWFAGYYFNTSITDPTFLGRIPGNPQYDTLDSLSQIGSYPFGIEFQFYCLAHIPEECTSPQKRLADQLSIRTKYRIDEADLSTYPGKTIKKKKNKKKSISTQNTSNQRVSNNLQKVKELNVDQYADNICAICLGPTHRMIELHPDQPNHTTFCSICNITVHLCCLNEYLPSPVVSDAKWTCERCAYIETQSIAPVADSNATPREEIGCHLCPRRGGAMMQRANDKKWVHYYCERHRPSPRSNTSLQIPPDEAAAPNAKEKKQNCMYCNRKIGVCVRCSGADDGGGSCSSTFHPLCASRSGDSYLRIRNGVKEHFCKYHIPSSVYHLPNGYWVDVSDISNLRKSLDSARLILDLIKSREKIKKRMYSNNIAALDSKIMHSFAKLKKKIGLPVESEELHEEELDDSQSESEDGIVDLDVKDEDMEMESPNKRGRNLTTRGTYSNVDFETDGELQVRVKLRSVELSGQVVNPLSVRNKSLQSYEKYLKDELFRPQDHTLGIFANQRARVELERKLKASLTGITEKTLLEVIKEGGGNAEDIKFAKLHLKNKGRRSTIQVTDHESNESSQKKRRYSTGVFDESSLATLLDQPMKKSRGRKSDFDNFLLSQENFVNFLSSNASVPGFETFLQPSLPPSQISDKSSISSWCDWSKDDHGIGEEEESTAQESIQLERKIFHILRCLCESVVPTKGVLAPSDEKTTMDCLLEMKNCLLDGKSLISDGWWNERYKRPNYEPIREVQGRLLIEDYEEIPSHLNYESLVTNVLTVDVLKRRLQDHKYSSFASFAKDFYEMLSNGRLVAGEHSKTWWDAYLLGGLFEFLRELICCTSPESIITPKSTSHSLRVLKVSNSANERNNSSVKHYRECPICSQKFRLEGYAFDPKSPQSSTSQQSWSWFCSECVNYLEKMIFGYQVKIFWVDDAKYYEGWVAALDNVSHEHRIKYGDGEWEFVRINREDYLIHISPDEIERFRKLVFDFKEEQAGPLLMKDGVDSTDSIDPDEASSTRRAGRRSTPRK